MASERLQVTLNNIIYHQLVLPFQETGARLVHQICTWKLWMVCGELEQEAATSENQGLGFTMHS